MKHLPTSPSTATRPGACRLTRREILHAVSFAAFGALSPAGARQSDEEYDPAVPGRPPPARSRFGPDATGDEVTEGLDLAGTSALITGCNSGFGFETMRVLAGRGAHVYAAARTMEKAEAACKSVRGVTTPIVIELTDFDSIVTAAAIVGAVQQPLDALILNAGVMGLPELQQVYGLERQFVTNHLGHFLLTLLLTNALVAAPHGRVVVVSSSAHVWAPAEGIQFDNLSGDKAYDPLEAYGQSKLANGLFSRELARRLAHTRATANALHPGVIPTRLSRHLSGADTLAGGLDSRMKTIAQGAATSCYVGTHPALRNVTGYYFADCNPAVPDRRMQDDAMAARLWAVSERLTATYRL